MRQGSTCNRCGHCSAVKGPGSVNDAFLKRGFFLGGLINAFDPCKALAAFIGEEHLLLQHTGKPLDAAVVKDRGKDRAVRDKKFPGGGPYNKIGVRRLQGLSHKGIESVENGENDYQCRCAYCHTCHANSRNHVDHVMAFPGKKVPDGKYERKLHFLSSSSMCSA